MRIYIRMVASKKERDTETFDVMKDMLETCAEELDDEVRHFDLDVEVYEDYGNGRTRRV